MLLLKICVRGTTKLGRAGLELLALEAVPVGSFGRKLLWLTAPCTKYREAGTLILCDAGKSRKLQND